jgi:predicted HTH transcriptional regulator
MNNFEEYLRQGEPNKAEKAKVWKMAIGLQQVDGLKPSDYLFFENLLQNENHLLKNREMHVHYVSPVNDTVKTQNDTVNDTVFYLIKQNSKITATEISEQLNISLSTAKRKIKELKENGTVERIGSDKTGYWKIIE